ncbi:MAG: CapA family protein [Sphingomonadaceae bacterium]|nr:CapA family protein [Sphingomonadaceae bacterium]
MQRVFLSQFALLLAVATPVAGAYAEEPNTPLQASGQVDTSFDGIAASGLAVEINEADTIVGADGRYVANVETASHYRIRISGPAIYPAVQTFGIKELYRPDCECLQLPAIQVVARKAGRVELFFAGDVMAGRRFSDPIWGERQLVDPANAQADVVRLLDPMRPYLEGSDLASVNLETVLAGRDTGNAPPKMVVFFSPAELADALKQVGVDYVTLGNNHSYDYLDQGIATTVAALDRVGLAWSGAGMAEEEALRASRLTVQGQDLSLLGYVGWKGRVTPNQVAEPGKGGAAFGSDANIAATVARETAAGRIVIAQYHGSMEYSDEPTPESERRVKLAVESGAALVASHHPHVTHGLEFYRGSLIAYSMGNFLFDQYFPETQAAFALKAWLDNGKVVRAEIIPLRILEYRPVPAVGSMREAVLDRVTQLSARRGTFVRRSGGHGLLLPGMAHSVADPVPPDMGNCGNSGQLLFPAGDFESAAFGDASDRTLKLADGVLGYHFHGTGGTTLQLEPQEAATQLSLQPATFFRSVGGNRITVCGMIWAPQAIQLRMAMQYREAGVGRMDALANAQAETGDQVIPVRAGEWTSFRMELAIPAGKQGLPARPMLVFAPGAGSGTLTGVIALDELYWVSGP